MWRCAVEGRGLEPRRSGLLRLRPAHYAGLRSGRLRWHFQCRRKRSRRAVRRARPGRDRSGAGAGPRHRRLHLRVPAQRRRPDHPARRLPGRGLSRRAAGRRRVHRRRRADRARPHRVALLGLRVAGRRARHPRAGEAVGERPSAGRGRDHPGHRGVVREGAGVLQHVRGEQRLVRSRGGGARCVGGRGAASPRAAGGRDAAGGPARTGATPSPHRRRARHGPLPRRRVGDRPGDAGAGHAASELS